MIKKTLLKVATAKAVREFYNELKLEEEEQKKEKERLEKEEELADFLESLNDEDARVELLSEYLAGENPWDSKKHLLDANTESKLKDLVQRIKEELDEIFSGQFGLGHPNLETKQ